MAGRPRKSDGTVLRGLLAARGKPCPQGTTEAARPIVRDSTRAASIALARAAERTHALPVTVRSVRFSTVSVAEISDILPERPLIAIVENPKGEAGFVALCPDLLASMIEMQALGRVTSRPAPARRPTRTDAAIAADFVNALLSELGHELAGSAGHIPFDSFRYVASLDDPRPLGLMLEDAEMAGLALSLRMGSGGQREGSLFLGLPAANPRLAPSPEPLTLPSQTSVPRAPGPSLARSVQDAPVTIAGILCRRKMTLRALRGLQPGSLIPLPGHPIDDAWIETFSGQVLARGRLGENEGFHAIRLRLSGSEKPAQTPQQPLSGLPVPVPAVDLDSPDPFRPPIHAVPPSGVVGGVAAG